MEGEYFLNVRHTHTPGSADSCSRCFQLPCLHLTLWTFDLNHISNLECAEVVGDVALWVGLL